MNKRYHERVNVRKRVRLIFPYEKIITASISNVSVTGLLISDLLFPMYKNILYCVEMPPGSLTPLIILSGKVAWQKEQCCGLEIVKYHFDSEALLQSLFADIKSTYELFEHLSHDS